MNADNLIRVMSGLRSEVTEEFGKQLENIRNPSLETANLILNNLGSLRKAARMVKKTEQFLSEIENYFTEKNNGYPVKAAKKPVERINSESNIGIDGRPRY